MMAELQAMNKNGLRFLIAVKNLDPDISYDEAYHFFHETLRTTEYNEFGGSHVQISHGKLIVDMQINADNQYEATHTHATTGISRPHNTSYLSRPNVKRLAKFIDELGITDELLYQLINHRPVAMLGVKL